MKTSNGNKDYLIKAAVHSKYNAMHWMRYLRKFISKDSVKITTEEADYLQSSSELTMYQKVCLKRALTSKSATFEYVSDLNQPVKAKMLETVKRKIKNV